MGCIELGQCAQSSKLKIMIFVEGTLLKPKSWFSLHNHTKYIPIGDCVNIIKDWQNQGAEVLYCTSIRGKKAEGIAKLLKEFGFVGSKLLYREKKQRYKDIVEIVRPDFLIEDDCKSIGGKWQMCITYVSDDIRNTITSIVVKEFKGIDHLRNIIEEYKN